MRRLVLAAAIGGLLVVALGGGSLAFGGDSRSGGTSAELIGYSEVPSVSTVARGEFRANIDGDDGEIHYRLDYEGLEGASTLFAHIHLGQHHTNGGVSAFLCGGGNKPACPAKAATIEGTIAASDVVGPAAQGIMAGELAELVRGIRAGAAYANVHTNTFPGGEIRGQLSGRGDFFNARGKRGNDG